MEVKAGIKPKSKSLKSHDWQFNPALLARANLLNLKKDGKIFNLPLYAVSLLSIMVASGGLKEAMQYQNLGFLYDPAAEDP
jgi:hypothetical protein